MPYLNFVSQEPGADAFAANAGYMEYGSDKTSTPGSFPFRVDQAGNISGGGAGLLQVRATTATNNPTGFPLANGTPTILSWTAPNDGAMHRFTIFSIIHVTTLEVGGLVNVTYTAPFAGATLHTGQLYAAGLGTDTAGQGSGNFFENLVAPGSTVSIVQGSALTSGAAVLFAEIWGS